MRSASWRLLDFFLLDNGLQSRPCVEQHITKAGQVDCQSAWSFYPPCPESESAEVHHCELQGSEVLTFNFEYRHSEVITHSDIYAARSTPGVEQACRGKVGEPGHVLLVQCIVHVQAERQVLIDLIARH